MQPALTLSSSIQIAALSLLLPLGTFQSAHCQQLQSPQVACGKDDFLLKRNQSFVQRLTELGVKHQYLETDGAHNWSVWRDQYLPQFLQVIFR